MRHRLLFLISMLLITTATKAEGDDDDNERRFAVQIGLSPSIPIINHEQTSALGGKARTTSGPVFFFNAEYFLTETPFAVTGGFIQEKINYYSADLSASLSELNLGARWYILPQTFPIQPYLGASTYWNLSARKNADTITMITNGTTVYKRDYNIKSPLISIAPIAGIDIYIFSCMALEIDYGFRMAIDGNAKCTTTFRKDKQYYTMTSSMHRHAFSVGLKFTFPFRFTSTDGETLINSLFNSL